MAIIRVMARAWVSQRSKLASLLVGQSGKKQLLLALVLVSYSGSFTGLVWAEISAAKAVKAKSSGSAVPDLPVTEGADSDDLATAPANNMQNLQQSTQQLNAEIDQALFNLAAANLDPEKYNFLAEPIGPAAPAILQKSHDLDELDSGLDFDLELPVT